MHLILISQKKPPPSHFPEKFSIFLSINSQSSFSRNRLHLSNDSKLSGFNICLHLSSLFTYAQTIFIRETTTR
ncbi:hypothetical protein Peur_008175 [Populus x canadensis]